LRGFEDMLRTIFRPKKKEVTRGWRKVQNEKLHNSYSSPNIIRVIKLRMRWMRHATCMVKMRSSYKICQKHEARHY